MKLLNLTLRHPRYFTSVALLCWILDKVRHAQRHRNAGGNRCGCAEAVRLSVYGARVSSVVKSQVRVALGAAALMLASGLHAELFLPVGPADAAGVTPAATTIRSGRSASTVPNAWEGRVRIARHRLAAARDDVGRVGTGRLLLNLRDGARLRVAVERTAPTKFGYSLSGRVVGGAAKVGFVTLVVHEEAVAGSVWTPDSAYELNYLGGGVHALTDVTNAPPVECAGALPSEPSALDTTVHASPDDTDDGSVVVDVLVVWTPAAEEQYGGKPHILSRIDMLVSYTNDALERSGALVSLNLVGAERVDYLEVGNYIDLGRLADPDDGHLDGVHDRREALGADLVNMWADVGPVGELGGAFSINALPHELGHNFGIGHERGEFLGSSGVGHYNFGFTTNGCYGTIMSADSFCPMVRTYRVNPIPYYGSPWHYSPIGRALGVSKFSKERGLNGPADAVLTLNRNRHRVANLQPSRNGD